ncbi:hypothetical protein H4582DRAFT_2127234 [Lactarius indigo]|nr:hypothetical protein H4582DRAFT_2127234 [Lactarius indigo]
MPDASKPIQKGSAPSHLIALPSLSNSLSSLPQAKSLAHVSVTLRTVKPKLKKALSNNAGSAQSLAYAPTPPANYNQASQPLMMRKPCYLQSSGLFTVLPVHAWYPRFYAALFDPRSICPESFQLGPGVPVSSQISDVLGGSGFIRSFMSISAATQMSLRCHRWTVLVSL